MTDIRLRNRLELAYVPHPPSGAHFLSGFFLASPFMMPASWAFPPCLRSASSAHPPFFSLLARGFTLVRRLLRPFLKQNRDRLVQFLGQLVGSFKFYPSGKQTGAPLAGPSSNRRRFPPFFFPPFLVTLHFYHFFDLSCIASSPMPNPFLTT